MRLGLLVTGVTYRHPGVLAKIVATLDVLSGGRAQLGVGAAWYEREHLGLGVPFPPLAERFERLEETLRICRQMWSEDDGPFVGRHYQLAETLCSPRPLSSPRLPILIGGVGEKKTLRLVARRPTGSKAGWARSPRCWPSSNRRPEPGRRVSDRPWGPVRRTRRNHPTDRAGGP